MDNFATVVGINGNIITIRHDGKIVQNEVAYLVQGDSRLKCEVIRIGGDRAELQVFEDTRGCKVGDLVQLTRELLSVDLGPGLLGSLYDGLQNPLSVLAKHRGFFLEKGATFFPLDKEKKWAFSAVTKVGNRLTGGDTLGVVPEGIFQHKIMVPFFLKESYSVAQIAPNGDYAVEDLIAILRDDRGKEFPLTMTFAWPIKMPITRYAERLSPTEPLITRIRIIDTLFPVALGGCYCIPGPFGSGKTVMQQITSRYAKVDIVIIAACGERANEVVETIREFPKLIDPNTGRSLMERTIIICNTSSMPVAARESSVYTAVTLAEYYRQMGLDVLLLADSTSRWAQALREKSGRLEEIPGEEAFPAYLESVIAAFYERSGLIRLKDGSRGSITIGGTVSPAGGNFEEPVTQATLKAVGAFHGLSQERADARKYPSIAPLESWSRYSGIIADDIRKKVIGMLFHANEIEQMMKVLGEEGVSLDDYVYYLKGELFDDCYLQQNAFDSVDAASEKERQIRVFSLIWEIINSVPKVTDKDSARKYFHLLRQTFLDYNSAEWNSPEFERAEEKISQLLKENSLANKTPPQHPSRESFIESELDSAFKKRGTAIVSQGEPGIFQEDTE